MVKRAWCEPWALPHPAGFAAEEIVRRREVTDLLRVVRGLLSEGM